MERTVHQVYWEMFQAKQAGDIPRAERLMAELEERREHISAKPSAREIDALEGKLPVFARERLGKNQLERGSQVRANCITAAFGFHDPSPIEMEHTTMEFLLRIKNEFRQLIEGRDYKFGDLVVMWSRRGGSWDGLRVNVHEMNPTDPDFPYGLVFDHVAVRVREDLVFHKPDPRPESRFQIDYLESAMSTTASLTGFELTFHRHV